jgi:YVTN family beta-propeller protein
MKFSHLAGGACFVVLCTLIAGCGDTFRPVATPLPQPAPDPQNFRIAAFTSCQIDSTLKVCNPTGTTSMVTDLNVSGDTVEGIVPVGHSPIFALVANNSFAAIVTTADFDNDTITQHSDSHGLGTTASAPAISAASTIGLPTGAKPASLVTANGTVYVAESGRNVVGVISGAPVALTTEIPVGTNPVNLTVLPNGKKVYVVNQADNSVTVISTNDNSVLATIGVGSNPVFAVPSADSTHVFIVNKGAGTVTVIDATTDVLAAVTCSTQPCATNPVPVGLAPNFAVTDVHNQRIVVTNSNSNSISIINADPTSPAFLGVTSVAVGTNPTSATPLTDGSRIYVANTSSNSVSVINSLSLTVSKTITVGTSPVSISSDAESAKVVTANRDSFDVSMINTSTDSEVTDATTGLPKRISAPQVDPGCNPATATCQRLSPIFIAVGAG